MKLEWYSMEKYIFACEDIGNIHIFILKDISNININMLF